VLPLPALDPVIHQPARLRIMGLLYRNRSAPTTWVRDTLGLTDGNLASHAAKLAEAGYIDQRRVLAPGGFHMRMAITPTGDEAYARYREALRALLDGRGVEPGAAEPAVNESDGARANPAGHG
jgi:DNA-binding MarR family transcriptional regulator